MSEEKILVKPFKDSNAIRKQFADRVVETQKVTLVTHNNCIDGAAVATAMKHWIRDLNFYTSYIKENFSYEVIFLDYDVYDTDELIKKLEGRVVFVADFSFDIGTHNEIRKHADLIVTLDHHKTPFESAVSDEPDTHFDRTKSGGRLAWEFLYPTKSVPKAILLSEDYDLYTFKTEIETRAFQLHSKTIDLMNPDGFIELVDNEPLLEEIIEKYTPDVHVYLNKCKKSASKAEPFDFNGEILYGLNLTSSVSDVLNIVSRTNDRPSFSYRIDGDRISFSFRNAKDDFDVAAFASKHFDGGGHEQSSGAGTNVKNIDMNKFIVDRVIRYTIPEEERRPKK